MKASAFGGNSGCALTESKQQAKEVRIVDKRIITYGNISIGIQ